MTVGTPMVDSLQSHREHTTRCSQDHLTKKIRATRHAPSCGTRARVLSIARLQRTGRPHVGRWVWVETATPQIERNRDQEDYREPGLNWPVHYYRISILFDPCCSVRIRMKDSNGGGAGDGGDGDSNCEDEME